MSLPMPPPEVAIDEALVHRLLEEQHPDLAGLPLVPFANGWDNTLLRLGPDLLVRLPRRGLAAELVRHEQRWLPELARSLPLPVPVPLRIGAPGHGYPWHWSVTPFLPGRPAAEHGDLGSRRAVEQLATFLARLHRPAPEKAPPNPFRGVPLAERAAAFAENLALAGDLLDRGRASSVWRDALSAEPWRGPRLWLHGDLHPANLLLEDDRLSGVVDFGDLTSGDPACDLAAVWMLFPRRLHAPFWTSYAEAADHLVDDDLRRRARGWALALGTVFLTRSADNPTMEALGRRTLVAVLR